MDKETCESILTILGAIGLVVVVILFAPFLNFILGYFIGWLISKTFGATLLAGLKLLGLNITITQLPLLCGTLNVIGSFFRNSKEIEKDKGKF